MGIRDRARRVAENLVGGDVLAAEERRQREQSTDTSATAESDSESDQGLTDEQLANLRDSVESSTGPVQEPEPERPGDQYEDPFGIEDDNSSSSDGSSTGSDQSNTRETASGSDTVDEAEDTGGAAFDPPESDSNNSSSSPTPPPAPTPDPPETGPGGIPQGDQVSTPTADPEPDPSPQPPSDTESSSATTPSDSSSSPPPSSTPEPSPSSPSPPPAQSGSDSSSSEPRGPEDVPPEERTAMEQYLAENEDVSMDNDIDPGGRDNLDDAGSVVQLESGRIVSEDRFRTLQEGVEQVQEANPDTEIDDVSDITLGENEDGERVFESSTQFEEEQFADAVEEQTDADVDVDADDVLQDASGDGQTLGPAAGDRVLLEETRESAADQFDRQFENVDVTEEDVVTTEDGATLDLDAQRQQAVRSLDEQTETDVGTEDVQFSGQDDGFSLTDQAQREEAATSLNTSTATAVTASDVVREDGSFTLTDEAEREEARSQAVASFESEVPGEVNPDNIQLQRSDDGGFRASFGREFEEQTDSGGFDPSGGEQLPEDVGLPEDVRSSGSVTDAPNADEYQFGQQGSLENLADTGEDVGDATGRVVDDVGESLTFENAQTVTASAITAVSGAPGEFEQDVTSVIGEITSPVTGAPGDIERQIRDEVSEVGGELADTGAEVAQAGIETGQEAAETGAEVVNAGVEAGVQAGEEAVDAAEPVVEEAVDVGEQAVETGAEVGEDVAEAAEPVTDPVAEGVEEATEVGEQVAQPVIGPAGSVERELRRGAAELADETAETADEVGDQAADLAGDVAAGAEEAAQPVLGAPGDIESRVGTAVFDTAEASRDVAAFAQSEAVDPAAGFLGDVAGAGAGAVAGDADAPAAQAVESGTENLTQGVAGAVPGVLRAPSTITGLGLTIGGGAQFTAEQIASDGPVEGTADSLEAGGNVLASGAVNTAETIASNPLQTAGSLVGSAALFRGAAAVGSRTGLASRAALQPGEELAGFAGNRLLRRAPGDLDRRLFPDNEPVIISEEAGIRGARRARDRLFGGSRERSRSSSALSSSSTSAGTTESAGFDVSRPSVNLPDVRGLIPDRGRAEGAPVRSEADSDQRVAAESGTETDSETQGDDAEYPLEGVFSDEGSRGQLDFGQLFPRSAESETETDTDTTPTEITAEDIEPDTGSRIVDDVQRRTPDMEDIEPRDPVDPDVRTVEGQDPDTLRSVTGQESVSTVSSDPDLSRSGPTVSQERAFRSSVTTETESDLSPRERQLQAQRTDVEADTETTQETRQRVEEAETPQVGRTGAALRGAVDAVRGTEVVDRMDAAQREEVTQDTTTRQRGGFQSELRERAETVTVPGAETAVGAVPATDAEVGTDVFERIDAAQETEIGPVTEVRPAVEARQGFEQEQRLGAETRVEQRADTEVRNETRAETETETRVETELRQEFFTETRTETETEPWLDDDNRDDDEFGFDAGLGAVEFQNPIASGSDVLGFGGGGSGQAADSTQQFDATAGGGFEEFEQRADEEGDSFLF